MSLNIAKLQREETLAYGSTLFHLVTWNGCAVWRWWQGSQRPHGTDITHFISAMQAFVLRGALFLPRKERLELSSKWRSKQWLQTKQTWWSKQQSRGSCWACLRGLCQRTDSVTGISGQLMFTPLWGGPKERSQLPARAERTTWQMRHRTAFSPWPYPLCSQCLHTLPSGLSWTSNKVITLVD